MRKVSNAVICPHRTGSGSTPGLPGDPSLHDGSPAGPAVKSKVELAAKDHGIATGENVNRSTEDSLLQESPGRPCPGLLSQVLRTGENTMEY